MNFCSVWLGSKLLCSLLSLVLSSLNEQLLLQGFDTYTGIIFREWVRDSGVTIHTLLRGLIEVLKEKYLSLIKGMVEFVEINKSVCEWGGMGCSNGCSLRPCTQMEVFYIPCWGGFVLYVCTMIPGTTSSRRLGMSLALWHLASPPLTSGHGGLSQCWHVWVTSEHCSLMLFQSCCEWTLTVQHRNCCSPFLDSVHHPTACILGYSGSFGLTSNWRSIQCGQKQTMMLRLSRTHLMSLTGLVHKGGWCNWLQLRLRWLVVVWHVFIPSGEYIQVIWHW